MEMSFGEEVFAKNLKPGMIIRYSDDRPYFAVVKNYSKGELTCKFSGVEETIRSVPDYEPILVMGRTY